MAEIEHNLITDCMKCANMVMADESEREKSQTTAEHRRFPDLGELIEHFGARDAWRMAREWPDSGVLIRKCKKCSHVWTTTTYDNVEVSFFGDMNDE